MKIKALFFDFDGVFTDNKVSTDSNGNEFVTCSKFDSQGLDRFRKKYPKFPLVVITSEKNDSVLKRCQKLKLTLIKAKSDKRSEIQKICDHLKILPNEVGFLGNDINDIDALEFVGLPIAVSDASQEVKKLVRLTTKCSGGNGAVREILDFFMLRECEFNEFHQIEFPKLKDMGFREWGKEELLAHIEGKYTFKRLILNKGSRGGLQFHRFKDECGLLLKGKLELRFTLDNKKLISKIINPGEVFHFPPFSIHQEIAIEECEILEVSNPIFNDRVKMEEHFNEKPQGGMNTTSINEILFL